LEDPVVKKLIIIAIVLAVAGQSWALKYPDIAPDFTCCDNRGWVIWEFIDDYCLPTSDEFNPPYEYVPGPAVEPPTFGSRHWDDPTDDAGWGGSYGEDLWTYSDGKYSVEAEDSFNQSIPHRGEKQFLRQYFQVVHTMPEGDTSEFGIIGLLLELWDMSVLGWTGCPQGYENLPGDGYLGGGLVFPSPDVSYEIPDSNGWYKSMWITDFWQDTACTTGYAAEEDIDLDLATHAVCIVGVDLDRPAQIYQIEEVILDFIWFDEADGSDIPTTSCCCPPPNRIIVDTNDIPIYEPQDTGGPPPAGPTDGQLQVSLAWQPGGSLGYPPFTAKVVINPDPNNEVTPNADFTFPASTEPNGVVRLIFNETNWDRYQNVHVAATQDTLREGNESGNVEFTVTIDIADCNFGGPGCEPVTRRYGIAVVDNDTPYISVLPSGQFMDVLSENDPCVPRCVNVTLSHQPTDNVEVLVTRESDFEILLESMSVMDPNHLLFDPCNYNVPQQICLEARDDEELAEAWLEWITGEIHLNGSSVDIRYRSEDEGGELEPTEVDFNVQDNDCGAWGYDRLDVNEDCYVNLGDVALLYSQWLFCTKRFEDPECDSLWNLVEEK
jgi:hypothetical protein